MITLSSGMTSCPWQLALKMFQEMFQVEVDVKLDPRKNGRIDWVPGIVTLTTSCLRIKHCKCGVILREFLYNSAWFGSVIHHDPRWKGCNFLPCLHEWLKTINCWVILGKFSKNVFVMWKRWTNKAVWRRKKNTLKFKTLNLKMALLEEKKLLETIILEVHFNFGGTLICARRKIGQTNRISKYLAERLKKTKQLDSIIHWKGHPHRVKGFFGDINCRRNFWKNSVSNKLSCVVFQNLFEYVLPLSIIMAGIMCSIFCSFKNPKRWILFWNSVGNALRICYNAAITSCQKGGQVIQASWICSRWLFYEFYDGKSPFNPPFGRICVIFPSTKKNKSKALRFLKAMQADRIEATSTSFNTAMSSFPANQWQMVLSFWACNVDLGTFFTSHVKFPETRKPNFCSNQWGVSCWKVKELLK